MIKKYLAFLSYLFLLADVVRCKPDYEFNEDAGGWFKLHRIPATWQEAFLRCHYEGAVLASPLDKQLADTLHGIMTQSGVNDNIFLGTHDLFSKGDFVSVEGVPLADMEEKFEGHDFKVDSGNCLVLTSLVPYDMHAVSCENRLPYICYRKLDNLTMNECGTFDNEYKYHSTGSCYKVHEEKQTWSTAYRICAAEGGHLVVLNDPDEARIVKEMFPAREGNVNLWEQFHIGLVAWGEDRTWITINGDRVEDVFHDWHPGQPDNYQGNQDHATFLRSGYMDDGNLKTRAMFVCEKSPESVLFEPLPQVIEERVE